MLKRVEIKIKKEYEKNSENEESLNLNAINISNGNPNYKNLENNFISYILEKIHFYDLYLNQETEIINLIKILNTLIKTNLFDNNFFENFNINNQKVTTNDVEINLNVQQKEEIKDFNVNIFSDENLDKYLNNFPDIILTNRSSNGALSGNKNKIENNVATDINNNAKNQNHKVIKNIYNTNQNNIILNNQNANLLISLANSGKFTSMTNFNNKNSDKLDAKSDISNLIKNNENKNELYHKVKNNNFLKVKYLIMLLYFLHNLKYRLQTQIYLLLQILIEELLV